MDKRSITAGRIAVAAIFALSCFGLLLFLWTSFNGPVPLQAKGYRIHLLLPEAPGLPAAADVRISGVPVGKVVAVKRSRRYTDATIQIEPRYAPLRRDVRAIVRRKTLLGEAYVELAPGDRAAPRIPEGGTVPASHVGTAVPLDQIYDMFDARTRRELQIWVQGWSRGMRGHATDISDGFGHLSGAAQNGADLLSELRSQRRAVATLTRDTGRAFGAIGAHESRVADLIRNGRALFATTAAGQAGLRATLRALPGFLSGLRDASGAVRRAAVPTTPLLRELRPAARALPETLAAAERVGPQLRAIAGPLDRAVAVTPSGLAAATRIVDAAAPLMDQLHPLGRYLVPTLDFANRYRREIITMFAKTSSANQALSIDPATGKPVHYLRAPAVVPAEVLIGDAKREPYSRANAYMAPGGLLEFLKGPLKALTCQNTGNPVQAPAPVLGAPPCIAQDPQTFRGVTGQFPQLRPAP